MTAITNTSSGTVVTTGSTTYISSTASGLNTSSLIAAAMATQTAQADTIDAQVTANTTKISAYTNVQSLVNAVASSIDDLASTPNLASGTVSLWTTTAASVTSSNTASTASSVVTATSSTAATPGTYTMTVSSLAQAEKVASSPGDETTALGYTGSFTIGSSDGTAATINVTPSMTLGDISNAISAQAATTGVNATMIQSASGVYTMVLATADTGQTITATTTSGDDVLTGIGVTAGLASPLQPSKDAVFTLDGTSITRTSNTIDDVIPGVSLDLAGKTNGSDTLTLNIAQDDSGVTTAVNTFVTAYNALHDYLEAQNAVSSTGAVASTAYLFGDSTLRSMDTQLQALITGTSATSGGSSSSISYLSQLGITFNSSNDLEVSDPTALATAVSSNPAALQNFFQTSYTTSNPSLLLLNNTSTVSQNFTLDIQAGPGGITGATVNGVSGLFTVSGNQLIGATGTPYAGLTFAITATANTSVNVGIQQGFADSMIGLANQYGNTSTGLIATEVSGLTTLDTSLSAQSALMRTQANAYETQLINKYATMETQISAAQTTQQEILAVLNGGTNNNG
jgi:flagellar hook-associated protein 2